MNYAIISPDSGILVAVGDEPRAYFYGITRDFDNPVLTENDESLSGWDWNLLRCVEMDIGTRFDEGCCFTVAFSPASRLCAIGSQSGIITIFDVATIYDIQGEPQDKNTVMCHFRSSRSHYHGGAVRCMSFSPEPWDLLVWIEDHGRAGVVDARQAFLRRQVLDLDINEPGLQEVRTEPISDSSLNFDFSRLESLHERDTPHRAMRDPIDPANDQAREGDDRLPLHESMIQDLTERERLIVEFLNTARWTSRLEEGLTERPPGRATLHPQHATHPRLPGSTDGASRVSRPTSPLRFDALNDFFRESYLERMGNADRIARRQNSVVLSQGNTENHRPETENPNVESQPSITLSWTASPSELQSTSSDNPARAGPTTGDPSIPSTEVGMAPRPYETTGRQTTSLDPSSTAADMIARRRIQRSSSIPRRSERPESTSESRYDTPRLLNSEMRANAAAERLRRQRMHPNHEVHTRTSPWEQRYRQQLLGFEQTRSPRWIRSILNGLPDRSLAADHRDQEPGGTAGIGWGADRRTL